MGCSCTLYPLRGLDTKAAVLSHLQFVLALMENGFFTLPTEFETLIRGTPI